jgi:hypothetical protein
MTQMLGGTWLQEVMASGDREGWPGVYWYRFGSNERRVDVLWRVNGAAPTHEVFCNCREALVRSWNGEVKYLLYTGDGNLTLRLEDPGAPMYVEYDPPVQPGGEYFDVTGHSIRGSFRTYWHRNGGMERFGYPLTEELVSPLADHGRPHVVQYFERARFEHFPGSPSEVSLTRLGDAALLRQGINWQDLPRVSRAPEECLYYAEVGHSICPPFLEQWQRYGGLAGLGLPLTEAYGTTHPETNEPYTVQHFERARLERDQNGGFRFGMIGREYLIRWGGMP